MIYILLLIFSCMHSAVYAMDNNYNERLPNDVNLIGQQFKDKNFRRYFREKTGYVPLCVNKNNEYLCVVKNKYQITTEGNTEKTTFFLKVVALDPLKNKLLNLNLIQDPEPTSTLYPKKARFNIDGSLLFIHSNFKNSELSVHKNPLFKDQINNNTRLLIGGTIEKNNIRHFNNLKDFTVQVDPITKYEYVIFFDDIGITPYRLYHLGIENKKLELTYSQYFDNIINNEDCRQQFLYLKKPSLFQWLQRRAIKLKIEDFIEECPKNVEQCVYDKKSIQTNIFGCTSQQVRTRAIDFINNKEYDIAGFRMTRILKPQYEITKNTLSFNDV